MKTMENKKYDNVMVDIETLGTKSNSVIISIAAVAFDINTAEVGPNFYSTVCIQSCIDRGFDVTGSTIIWWLGQGDKAQKAISIESTPIDKVIRYLCDYFEDLPDDVKVWGNSARFDLGIIENAFIKCNKKIPWDYYNERDVRTLVSLCPEIKKEMVFDGPKHHALYDCLHQIKYTCKIFNKLKN